MDMNCFFPSTEYEKRLFSTMRTKRNKILMTNSSLYPVTCIINCFTATFLFEPALKEKFLSIDI